MSQYSDEQMKLMRLAGINTGYGITEQPTSHPSPSVYEAAPVEKTARDEFLPMGEYDFDSEVSSLVGSPSTPEIIQSEAASVVLSSLAKMQSLIISAMPMMSEGEKARVSEILSEIMDSTCV